MFNTIVNIFCVAIAVFFVAFNGWMFVTAAYVMKLRASLGLNLGARGIFTMAMNVVLTIFVIQYFLLGTFR